MFPDRGGQWTIDILHRVGAGADGDGGTDTPLHHFDWSPMPMDVDGGLPPPIVFEGMVDLPALDAAAGDLMILRVAFLAGSAPDGTFTFEVAPTMEIPGYAP